MKTVLVVGIASGGAATIRALIKALPADYRVVAVNAQDYVYWPIGALRAAVVPGWEDKVVAPLTGLVPAGSRHLVLGGSTVVSVDFAAKEATLDEPREELGGEKTIGYEFIVIATGSSYSVPCRPPPDAKTIPQIKGALQNLQKEVAAAQNILIVGTGPVGIEFAGEVTAQFGKGSKKVTLVGAAEQLFPQTVWKPKFRSSVAKQIETSGVRLILGARADVKGAKTGAVAPGTSFSVVHSNGETEDISADFILVGMGNAPNSAFLPPTVLLPSGHVKTNDYLEIPGAPGAFALGDVTDCDVKLSAATPPQAALIVKNILLSVKGKALSKHKRFPDIMAVPLGPGGGAAQLFGFVLGPWFTAQLKGKTLFTPRFIKEHPENYPQKSAWSSYLLVTAALIGLGATIRAKMS